MRELQVKLFVELFSSKFQSLWFKILRASGEDLKPLAGELERNLEVGSACLGNQQLLSLLALQGTACACPCTHPNVQSAHHRCV